MKAEEKALVLDYLPRGRSSGYKTEPLAQLIGTEYFTLLEVIPKKDSDLKALEEVYVGKENRPKIDFIKRRIAFKDLTSNSLAELEKAVEKIVADNKQKYLDFYNAAQSITIKRHQLELLPGLGKKHMLQIVSEREKGAFESFEDLEKRVHLMPNPIRAIVGRVVEELEGNDVKYYLFARPPAKEHELRPRHRF